MLEVGVGGVGHPVGVLQLGQLGGHRLEMGRAGPDRGPEVGRGHERRVEVRLLGEQAEAEVALADDRAAVGLVEPGREPEQRRLAGAVGPDEADAVADGDRGVDFVEDDERADLAGDPLEPEQAHRSPPGDPVAVAIAARAAARRRGRRPLRPIGPRLVGRPFGLGRRQPERRRRRRARSSAARAGRPVPPTPPVIVARIAPRLPGRPPAAAGTTSRSASPGRR